MKNKIIHILLFFCISLSFSLLVKAQNVSEPSSYKSGTVTLNGRNSNNRAFCFRDGQFVKFVSKTKVTNDCPDIIFNFLNKNSFDAAYAPVGYGGRIENIGSIEEIRLKYKITDEVNDENLFDFIKFNGKKRIVFDDRDSNRVQRIQEADGIFRGAEFHYANVQNKHIYIVRYSDDINFSFQRIVKFIVTDFKANEYVTIKWEILFDDPIYENQE